MKSGKAESAEQSIQVEIYNQTYSIRSDGDNEYILRLAKYVDGKMRAISSGTLTVDSLKVAILAGLHIADELHQAKLDLEQTDVDLAKRSGKCTELLDHVLKYEEALPQQEIEMEQ